MRADLQQIAEIESYLLDEMTSADRLLFEQQLLTNSQLRKQVEFQQDLMKGIENVALKVSAQSAYGKFKIKSLLTKLFLSCLIAGAVTTSVLVMSSDTQAESKNELAERKTMTKSDESRQSIELVAVANDTVVRGAGPIEKGASNIPLEANEITVVDQDRTMNKEDATEAIPPNPDTFDESIGRVLLSFSPDGDGVNDFWSIPVHKKMKAYDLRVYEMDGVRKRTLFKTDDPDEKWDGTNKGLDVPAGTYTYSWQAIGADGSRYKKGGKITLSRLSDVEVRKPTEEALLDSNLQSSIEDLWIEIFDKKGRQKQFEVSNLSEAVESIEQENWSLMIPNNNLSSFCFRLYNHEGKQEENLVFTADDPDFRCMFTNKEIFQKDGAYYYTIEGTGLDGRNWFIEDKLVWEAFEEEKKWRLFKRRSGKSNTPFESSPNRDSLNPEQFRPPVEE